MKRRLAAFGSLALPLLLTIFLLGLVRFAERHRTDWDRSRRREILQRQAIRQADRFRSGYAIEDQLGQANRRFQVLLGRRLETEAEKPRPDFTKVLAGSAAETFRHSFPEAYRRGAKIYLFSLDRDDQAIPCTGPGLTTRKGRIMADLFGLLRLAPGLEGDQLLRAIRRCSGILGLGTPLNFLSPSRRSRATLASFEAQSVFLVWDTLAVKTPSRKSQMVAGYFLVIPKRVAWTGRPIQRALLETSRRGPSYGWPVLVPVEARTGVKRIHFPSRRLPPGLAPFLRRLSRLPSRGTRLPHGTLLTEEGSWLIYRDLLSLHSSFEIWIVMPAGLLAPKSRASPSVFLSILVGVFWVLVLAGVMITGRPPGFSLQVWLPAFFLLVGALPLCALYQMGATQIRITQQREVQTITEQAIEDLEQVDRGTAALFQTYVNTCRTIMAKPGFDDACRRGTRESLTWAAKMATAEFQGRGFARVHFLYLPMDGENHIFVDGKRSSREASYGLLQMYLPTMEQALVALRRPVPEAISSAGSAAEDMVGKWMAAHGTYQNLGERRGDALVNGLGQGLKASSEEGFVLHFPQIVTKNGDPHAFISFLVTTEWAVYKRIVHVVSRYNRSVDPFRWIALGWEIPRGVRRAFPLPNGKFWNTSIGINLHGAMTRSVRLRSREILQNGDSLFVAQRCRQAPWFVLGTHAPLQEIRRKASLRQFLLAALSTLIGLFILELSLFISRYLVIPLRRVEEGLLKSATGDLNVRVGQPREDELGHLTRTFDHMITGLQKRQDLGRFVSGSLDASISRGGLETMERPQHRSGTVLISDLRDFTTHSERHPPEEIVAMLNEHLELMTGCIHAHHGLIERFIGDAVVAVFFDGDEGSPASGLANALQAACRMRLHHDGLQKERKSVGKFPYEMGVGIDTGLILSGTISSSGRWEHALLGQVRNTAEKLESLSRKGTRTRIILSPAAVEHARRLFPPLEVVRVGFQEGWELGALLPPGEPS